MYYPSAKFVQWFLCYTCTVFAIAILYDTTTIRLRRIARLLPFERLDASKN